MVGRTVMTDPDHCTVHVTSLPSEETSQNAQLFYFSFFFLNLLILSFGTRTIISYRNGEEKSFDHGNHWAGTTPLLSACLSEDTIVGAIQLFCLMNF
jgi:hypothetical protein